MHKTTLTIICLLMSGCFNFTGQNKEAAENNARSFAKELGMDLKGLSCNKHDTDGDGYVSCTFSFDNGSVKTFECAGVNLIQNNEGCREPKIKIQNTKK